MKTSFPLTRLAVARFCVLLAMRLLPADAWAQERLFFVNQSLKMHIAAIRRGDK